MANKILENNRLLIADEFRQAGLSEVAIAGMLGRISRESSFNTNAYNPNDAGPGKHSRGIWQWNRERLAGLKAFAKEQGLKWTDPRLQARFTLKELQGPEKRVLTRLNQAKTVQEAADAAMTFARPKGSYIQKGGKITWTPRSGLHYKETLADAKKFYAGKNKDALVDTSKIQNQAPAVEDEGGGLERIDNPNARNNNAMVAWRKATASQTADTEIAAAQEVVNKVNEPVRSPTEGVIDPDSISSIIAGFMPRATQAPAPKPPGITEMQAMFRPRLQWASL
jgi:hypothetical protein